MDLLRTKSVDALTAVNLHSGLKKTLGSKDLVLLGIGCIVGTGIFVLTGVAAAKYAGPGVMLSFLISAVTCALAAFAYAELASIVPVSGSAYTYAYASLGEFIAFVVGWDLILEYTVAASAVASGWSGYFTGLLKSGGIDLPVSLTKVPMDGGIINLPAVIITVLLSVFLLRGTKESAMLNRILVVIKLAVIALFLFLAAPHVQAANWTPFMPFGFGGVAAGASIVFFAYIGFDAVATSAEECRNPKKDLPVCIVGSLVVCALLYFVVAGVLTGAVPYTELNNAEPVAYALRVLGYNAGAAIVAVGAICGITTVLLVLLYGQARIFYALSRDGMIPSSICKVHPKYQTPYIVTIIGAIVVACIAAFAPIGIIAEMANIGTLMAFLIASIGVWVLRRRQPELHRGFRCPAVNIVAPLSVLCCAYLIYHLPIETWIRFFVWFAVGLCVYFSYSYHHSKINEDMPEEAHTVV